LYVVMSPPTAPTGHVQRAPLDVYKKITIVRKSTDSVVYETSDGKLKRFSDLGEAALAAVSVHNEFCFFHFFTYVGLQIMHMRQHFMNSKCDFGVELYNRFSLLNIYFMPLLEKDSVVATKGEG